MMKYMDRNYLDYKSTKSILASKRGVIYFALTSVLTYDLLHAAKPRPKCYSQCQVFTKLYILEKLSLF